MNLPNYTAKLAAIISIGLVVPGFSEPMQTPNSCTDCHQTAVDRDRSEPPGLLLNASIHASLDCTDCHETMSMDALDMKAANPHGASSDLVDCAACHEDQADTYVMHGRVKVGTNPDIPTCAKCHGAHDILPPSEPQSRVNPDQLCQTCQSCHTNVNLIKNHNVLRDEPIKLYEGSVHGTRPQGGSCRAATCADCHAANGEDGQPTAHRILSPANPASTVNRFNVPQTCGRCHSKAVKDYEAGIHGRLARLGETDAPVCTQCHGEHGILPVSDLRSPVSAARVAEATCSPCHESVALDERFGVPDGSLKSYIDTYHGQKRKSGKVHVANCASCHGHHRILPQSDPTSSINPANLQNTCGTCHPGISAVVAQAPIHETPTTTESPWVRFFTVAYQWLIGLTIGLMLLHNLAHWFRHVRQSAASPSVVRLSRGEVAQHWVLMISFTVLVLSGFSLRFSQAWWVQLLFGWGGGAGFVIRGTVHRVAAVVFMVWAVWHLIYLCRPRGRRWLRAMIGSKRDLQDIKANTLFFLGRRRAQPRFGRFSYMEKLEYWALIWGSVIMVITGVLLWFENAFIDDWGLRKGLLDVAHVIHYYEAWLATLAILVWHLYGTVFNPSVYPMNPAWWAGRMPKTMHDEEHPEDSNGNEPLTDSDTDDPGTH